MKSKLKWVGGSQTNARNVEGKLDAKLMRNNVLVNSGNHSKFSYLYTPVTICDFFQLRIFAVYAIYCNYEFLIFARSYVLRWKKLYRCNTSSNIWLGRSSLDSLSRSIGLLSIILFQQYYFKQESFQIELFLLPPTSLYNTKRDRALEPSHVREDSRRKLLFQHDTI